MLDLTLEILRTLVSRNTSNPPRRIGRDGVLADVEAWLRPAGFDCAVEELGDGCVNLLAVRGRPSGLFNVHLDTVPASGTWSGDPWSLRVEGGRAVGLGACDVKGAAACLIAAAMAGNGPAALLFTSDEEAGDARCVRTFLDRPPAWARWAIVAEPTGNRAVTAHRGLRTCEGVFRGTGGHGSVAGARTRNAVHDAARWIVAALGYAEDAESLEHDGLHGIRLNVGVVEGGVKPNVVAPEARVQFGVRPLPNQDAEALMDDLQSLRPEGAAVEWLPRFTAPPLMANERSRRLVERLGLEAGPAVDFWTEAALFAEAGLATVVLGPGDIAQAHAADEWVALEQLEEAAATYRRLFSHGTDVE